MPHLTTSASTHTLPDLQVLAELRQQLGPDPHAAAAGGNGAAAVAARLVPPLQRAVEGLLRDALPEPLASSLMQQLHIGFSLSSIGIL